MKIFLIILILFLSTYIGYSLTDKYKIRKDFFIEFYEFNLKMLNNVSFSNETVSNILINEKGIFYEKFLEFFNKKNFQISFLSNDETIFFQDYISFIGKSDSESQKDFFKIKENELFSKKNFCEKIFNKNKSLFIKISFLIGVILSIVIL